MDNLEQCDYCQYWNRVDGDMVCTCPKEEFEMENTTPCNQSDPVLFEDIAL